MSEEQQLRQLYADAKAEGRVDLQEKIITRLEQMKMQQSPSGQGQVALAPELSALDKRAIEIGNSNQNPIYATIQTAGLGIRGYLDQGIKLVTDNLSDEYKEQFVKNAQVIAETPPGWLAVNAMEIGGELWDEVKKLYPDTARTVEDLTLIGGIGYGAKSFSQGIRQVKNKAYSLVNNAERRMYEGYVAPYINARNVRETRKYWKSEKRGLKGVDTPVFRVAAGTEYDEMVKALQTVDGINPNMTNLQVREVLVNHLRQSADDVIVSLREAGVVVPRARIKGMKGSIARRFNKYNKAKPATVKEIEAQKQQIDNIIKGYRNSDGSITAADLVKVRRDFDHEYTRAASEQAMNPSAKASRKKDLWLASRDAINDAIEQASGKKYKAEMRRQRNLYKVKDNVNEKADHEILMTRDRNEDMATRQARRVFAKTLLGGNIKP